ncbi:hypothetical protein CDAR_531831 [Caerostris darwini]|uniref:Uncharacterized protein n=1 Tax=Caerostris darwini TaxID=1538125 RepID=A0AAV4V9U5_9ARAC|nr:hypothetical protein CDAR_531831 [Caerostris darwini]
MEHVVEFCNDTDIPPKGPRIHRPLVDARARDQRIIGRGLKCPGITGGNGHRDQFYGGVVWEITGPNRLVPDSGMAWIFCFEIMSDGMDDCGKVWVPLRDWGSSDADQGYWNKKIWRSLLYIVQIMNGGHNLEKSTSPPN